MHSQRLLLGYGPQALSVETRGQDVPRTLRAVLALGFLTSYHLCEAHSLNWIIVFLFWLGFPPILLTLLQSTSTTCQIHYENIHRYLCYPTLCQELIWLPRVPSARSMLSCIKNSQL